MDEIFETGILNWGDWERDRETKTERDRDTQRGKTTGEGKRRRGNRCVNWNGMFIIKQ